MRKIFALLLVMFGITLSSCGGEKQDLKSLRTVGDIDAEIKESLNINFDNDTNSTKLYTDTRDSKSYYDIYVASSYTETLFIHQVDLKVNDSNGNPIINDRTKELYANTLSFNVKTYQDELPAILNEIYNEKNGISKLNFSFELTKDHNYSKKAYTMDDKFLPEAVKSLDDLKLEIVYLPVYAVRTYEEKRIYKNYFFIPLHYAFVTGDKQIKVNHEKDTHYELINKEVSGIEVSDIKLDPNDSTKVLSTLKPAEENK